MDVPPRVKTLPAVLLLGLTAMAMLPAVRSGFKVDDGYVLANAASPRLSDRLFAWNVDRPSPSYGAWYDGVTVQRRFVRILPSVLMSLQVAAFGANAQLIHGVALGVHFLNTLFVLVLVRRLVADDWTSMLVAGIFALHPVAAEPIGHMAAQPLLVATAFSLLSALALARYRERPRTRTLTLLALSTAAAVTSYEAAIGLPIVLLAGDLLLGRHRWMPPAVRWGPRVAALASIPLALALTFWNTRGVTAPETSYRPALSEVWYVGRIDLQNYLLKAVAILNPSDNEDYWLHNTAGEPVAAAVALALVAAVAWFGRRSRLAWFGVLTFCTFLAPPLLMRATIGLYNYPTHRQLYLPLLGLAALVAAGAGRSRPVAALAIVPALVVMAVLSANVGASSLGWADARRGSAAARRALADVPPDRSVILVGEYDCAYTTAFDWPRRVEWRLVPPTRSGARPVIRRVDEHTFVATAPSGFAMPATEVPPSRPWDASRYEAAVRHAVRPVDVVSKGRQRLDGASVERLAGDHEAVRALRFRLDRPITEYVFLFAAGCNEMESHQARSLPPQRGSPGGSSGT